MKNCIVSEVNEVVIENMYLHRVRYQVSYMYSSTLLETIPVNKRVVYVFLKQVKKSDNLKKMTPVDSSSMYSVY